VWFYTVRVQCDLATADDVTDFDGTPIFTVHKTEVTPSDRPFVHNKAKSKRKTLQLAVHLINTGLLLLLLTCY